MERETKNTKENNLPTRCSSVGAATDQWLGLPPRPRFRSALGMRLFTRGKAEVDQAARFRFSPALSTCFISYSTLHVLHTQTVKGTRAWQVGLGDTLRKRERGDVVVGDSVRQGCRQRG